MKLFPLVLATVIALFVPSSLLARQTQLLYATELEAVIAAADLFNPRSVREDREFMGTIFQSDGFFGYTVTAGAARANRISIAVPAHEWDRVVAFWHTHGDDAPMHRYYSQQDTTLVQRHQKPLYLADYTGYLKVFRPEHRVLSRYAAERLGLPARSGFAIGEYVQDEYRRRVRIRTLEDADSS
ncbi:MAG: DUF4329 domain-containing protein [Gammaproteobacteria bacterium]